MATFIWQSIDGDFDNPESWGVAPIVDGINASTVAADATVSLPGATDLSGVSAGDTLKLVGNAEGKNSGQYYEITAVNDGADTVEVSPTPASNDANITWIISEALPGANSANDDIHFPGLSQVGVTSGLDQSGQGKFANVLIFPEYSGQIAFIATPLQIGVTVLEHWGRGALHLQESSIGSSEVTISSGNELRHTTRGTITNLIISSSVVDILSGGIDSLHITEETEVGQPTSVTIEPAAGVVDVFMNAGFCSCADSISNLYMGGGKLVFEVSAGAGAISFLYQFGGHLVYNATGTVTAAIIMGGFLDYFQDARDKTITFLRVFPGAMADLPSNVVVTNGGPLGGQRFS